ncbi:MAG: 50S ribosomal protein L11 methyltransferase [Hyphomicrobiales bacterium]|nr:50S ribosomal protein L11 methyltransferase [Hyphomicrobiales bacterium]
MTVKATLTAAFPEARRIAEFLERDFADDGGVVALVEIDPESWQVDAYFPDGDPDEITGMVRDRLGTDAFGAFQGAQILPEADWVAESLAGLAPVAAGRFLIHGSHDQDALPAGRVRIAIDAGQAFGTGHHGSTAGCLAALDRIIRRHRFVNPLDLGTGSGVLAIALAKTLCTNVLASDIDPLAVRIAAENTRQNTVGNRLRVIAAAGMDHAEIRARAPFDLIIANILAGPLMKLAPQIAAALAPGGTLVLSGLLPGQRQRVVAAYGVQGVRLMRAQVHDGWAVLELRRA